MSKTDRSPTVFVSYAHEGPESPALVDSIAATLTKAQCHVITDRAYRDKAPPQGWTAWMLQGIQRADTVVVICSPLYANRFERHSDEQYGKGVRFEGLIIVRELYDKYLVNDKVVPVLPEDGEDEHVPPLLRDWFCGIRVPKDLDRLRSAVLGEYVSVPLPAAVGGGSSGQASPGDARFGPDGEWTVGHPSRDSGIEVIREAMVQIGERRLCRNLKLAHFASISPEVELKKVPREQAEQFPDDRMDLGDLLRKFTELRWPAPTDDDSTVLPMIALEGRAGVGKTTCLQQIATRWARDAETTGRLAIYVHLSDIEINNQGARFYTDLDRYLRKVFRAGINWHDLTRGEQTQPYESIILILDGLDEAALHKGLTRPSLLGRLVEFAEKDILMPLRRSSPDFRPPIRGLVVSTRDSLTYYESNIINGGLVLKLQDFEKGDRMASWLSVFNRHVKPRPELSAEDFTEGDYASLGSAVCTPLYLYLAALCNAADSLALDNVVQDSCEDDAEVHILEMFIELAAGSSFERKSIFQSPADDVGGRASPSEFAEKVTMGELLEGIAYEALANSRRELEFGGSATFPPWLQRALPESLIGKNLSLDEFRVWLGRNMPLEATSETASRFPHLSVLECLAAKKLVTEMCDTKCDPQLGWERQGDEVRALVLSLGRIPVSDRTFTFITKHINHKIKTGYDTHTNRERIRSLTKFLSTLDDVIIPGGKHGAELNPEEPEQALGELGPADFITCPRAFDLGMRIANVGLPLHAHVEELTAGGASIGRDGGTDRYRFKRYLHLANYLLDRERMKHADLSRLPLRALQIRNSSLEGAEMNEAILHNLSMSHTDLDGANFYGAKMPAAKIGAECRIRFVVLVGVDLREAKLERITFESANCDDTDFSDADLTEARFDNCNLSNAKFTDAMLGGTRFRNCNMTGVNLERSKLTGARFEVCTLLSVNFKDAMMDGAVFVKCVVINVVNLDSIQSADGVQFDDVLGLTRQEAEAFARKGASGKKIKYLTDRLDDLVAPAASS